MFLKIFITRQFEATITFIPFDPVNPIYTTKQATANCLCNLIVKYDQICMKIKAYSCDIFCNLCKMKI